MAHFVDLTEIEIFHFIHFSLNLISNPVGYTQIPSEIEKRLSPKNTKFFISGPIVAYDSSFCRYQRDKQLLLQQFFSKTNI